MLRRKNIPRRDSVENLSFWTKKDYQKLKKVNQNDQNLMVKSSGRNRTMFEKTQLHSIPLTARREAKVDYGESYRRLVASLEAELSSCNSMGSTS